MAEQVEEIPADDVTMPDEEMAMAGAGEMDAMPDEEMAMTGEIQAIELPGTWKLILSRIAPKSSGRS